MITKVLLNPKREEYCTSQIKYTFTVGELIDALSQFHEDDPIYFSNDNGYTYGAITDDSISIE